jgi:hypothetical protein
MAWVGPTDGLRQIDLDQDDEDESRRVERSDVLYRLKLIARYTP